MSLADELLADLEDDTFDVADVSMSDNLLASSSATKTKQQDIVAESVREIAKLQDSELVQRVVQGIDKYSNHKKKSRSIVGPIEDDPEYQLIVEANDLAVEIENELNIIYRFVVKKYSKRFPELESLVANPLEYIMTVKELGNNLDGAKSNEKLPIFLTQATIMVVSVTASTTRGQELTETEKESIFEACNMAIDLNNLKQKILEYVESRMTLIAPNLSAIVGSSTAAKLMGAAGGLLKLSSMPSSNILLLGNQKTTLSGFSRVSTLPHTGFIYYSDIVQDMPAEFRRKVSRIVAGKATLAARVDACHESRDGSTGRKFYEEIEKKFDKLTEPPPVKFAKPLPKPIEAPKKKRGGKRVRKMKERYAMTDFRKAANRINFAELADSDAYQEDLGYNRGTIGKKGSGRIRATQIDEKTKVRISKTLQQNLQKQQTWGGTSTVKKQISGTASSVAFTPAQGLEIINPQANEKRVSEADQKYFSHSAGFLNLKK